LKLDKPFFLVVHIDLLRVIVARIKFILGGLISGFWRSAAMPAFWGLPPDVLEALANLPRNLAGWVFTSIRDYAAGLPAAVQKWFWEANPPSLTSTSFLFCSQTGLVEGMIAKISMNLSTDKPGIVIFPII